ncbi:hypothetical protein RI367_004376 [Sorochytrium milnesiophthora]
MACPLRSRTAPALLLLVATTATGWLLSQCSAVDAATAAAAATVSEQQNQAIAAVGADKQQHLVRRQSWGSDNDFGDPFAPDDSFDPWVQPISAPRHKRRKHKTKPSNTASPDPSFTDLQGPPDDGSSGGGGGGGSSAVDPTAPVDPSQQQPPLPPPDGSGGTGTTDPLLPADPAQPSSSQPQQPPPPPVDQPPPPPNSALDPLAGGAAGQQQPPAAADPSAGSSADPSSDGSSSGSSSSDNNDPQSSSQPNANLNDNHHRARDVIKGSNQGSSFPLEKLLIFFSTDGWLWSDLFAVITGGNNNDDDSSSSGNATDTSNTMDSSTQAAKHPIRMAPKIGHTSTATSTRNLMAVPDDPTPSATAGDPSAGVVQQTPPPSAAVNPEDPVPTDVLINVSALQPATFSGGVAPPPVPTQDAPAPPPPPSPPANGTNATIPNPLVSGCKINVCTLADTCSSCPSACSVRWASFNNDYTLPCYVPQYTPFCTNGAPALAANASAAPTTQPLTIRFMLTFSGHPAPTTPDLLELLRQKNVTAVFTIDPYEMYAAKQDSTDEGDAVGLAKRLLRDGHAVGLHYPIVPSLRAVSKHLDRLRNITAGLTTSTTPYVTFDPSLFPLPAQFLPAFLAAHLSILTPAIPLFAYEVMTSWSPSFIVEYAIRDYRQHTGLHSKGWIVWLHGDTPLGLDIARAAIAAFTNTNTTASSSSSSMFDKSALVPHLETPASCLGNGTFNFKAHVGMHAWARMLGSLGPPLKVQVNGNGMVRDLPTLAFGEGIPPLVDEWV